MPKRQIKHLEKSINKKDGFSRRISAKKFNVSQQYISKIINKKTSIGHRKKTKAPKRTTAQEAAVRPKCRKLVLHKLVALFRKKLVIIDDESYFPLVNTNLSGNSVYYTSDPDAMSNEVNLRKRKYEPKLIVWVDLSEKGVSKHYITPSRQVVDKEVYISKCLVKLKKFINEVRKNDEIVFWADLSSAHYSNKVQDYLKGENIEYVPRDKNPPNVPELHPIEDFWTFGACR